MSNLLSFSDFIFEAKIEDEGIKAQIEHFHSLQERIKEMKSALKEAEDEFKGFEVSIRPLMDSMKMLNDKVAETERYLVQINRYGHSRTDIGWKSVVEGAMERVDDAAKAILEECMEASKKVVEVKHSFEIKVNEANLLEKVKNTIMRALNSFKKFFASKLGKIDSENAKLEKLLAKLKAK